MKRWRLFPETLFVQLVVVWLCSLFLVKALTLCTVSDWGDQILFRHMVNTEARLLSLYSHVLTRRFPQIPLKADDSTEIDPNLRVSFSTSPPVLDEGSAELSRLLHQHIIPFLSKGRVDYGQLLTSVQVISKNSRVSQLSTWGLSLPTFTERRVVRADVAIQLKGSLWLRLEHDTDLLANSFLGFQFIRLMGEMGFMLAVTLLVVSWIMRPLGDLAQAAERVGRDPVFVPLRTDIGPKEVRKAAGAFNRMHLRMKAYVEERGHILAAVSHDLRTPLTRLRLRLEQVESPQLRDKLVHDVDTLRRTLDTTISLVRSLNSTAPKEPTAIMPLLTELTAERREVGQPVSLHGHVERVLLLCPTALTSCFENLVDNALRYAAPGEVRVLVHEENTAEGTRLCIDVQDSGPGIPEDQLESVFEPYCRLEPSRNTGTGGYGLGLAIARNLARQNGGDITLSNIPNGGLTARITFGINPAHNNLEVPAAQS